MAQPQSSLQLRQPSSHYTSQAGLAVALARLLRNQPDLDRRSLYALLTRFAQASATLAARDYAARRMAEGAGSGFTVPLAPAPTVEHFTGTLNYVYADPQATQDRMVAALTRLALQGGRQTVVNAVEADPKARAWAREVRPDCCYFCAMLATRGAVYKSDQTAGSEANARFTGSGSFKFHNNCHCIAVPVFGQYEKTAEVRAWTRQWHDLRREHGGVSLSMWRHHFEGLTAPANVPQTAGTI